MPPQLVAKLTPQEDLRGWLTEQRNGLGGNDAGAVLGVHPFQSARDVFMSKTSRSELPASRAEEAATPLMRRGLKLEAIAADEYTEATGIKLQRGHAGLPVGILADSERPYLRMNFDRVVMGQKALAEIKVVSLKVYAEMRAKGLRQYVWVQGQHYLGVSGYDRMLFIIFSPERWEFLGQDQGGIWVERDDEFISLERERLGEFWHQHVLAGLPPLAAPPSADAEKIPEIPASEIVTMDSPAWAEAADLLREAREIILGGEQLEDVAKKRLQDLMTEAGAQVAQGGCLKAVHWKPSKPRASWDGKAMAPHYVSARNNLEILQAYFRELQEALGPEDPTMSAITGIFGGVLGASNLLLPPVDTFRKIGAAGRPFKPYFNKSEEEVTL